MRAPGRGRCWPGIDQCQRLSPFCNERGVLPMRCLDAGVITIGAFEVVSDIVQVHRPISFGLRFVGLAGLGDDIPCSSGSCQQPRARHAG
jgi:hypothetical protein